MVSDVVVRSVESQWPKIEGGLIKAGLDDQEVDAVRACFFSTVIPDPSIVDFLTTPIKKNTLIFLGDKATELLLFRLALQFYDLASDDKKVVSACIKLLRTLAPGEIFFALHFLNELLDRRVSLSKKTLSTIESIRGDIPAVGDTNIIVRHELENFIHEATFKPKAKRATGRYFK